MFHKSSISIIEAMQRLAGERIKYAVSNDKSKNAGYMGVSHYILRFVYSFLYILLLITLRIPITLYVKKMLIGSWIRFLVNLIVR